MTSKLFKIIKLQKTHLVVVKMKSLGTSLTDTTTIPINTSLVMVLLITLIHMELLIAEFAYK